MKAGVHALSPTCVFALASLFACGTFGSADDSTLASADASAEGGANDDGGTSTNDGGGADGAAAAPTVVAVSTMPIPIIAVDATRVVWTTTEPEGGAIHDLFDCPKTGCVNDKPRTLESGSPVATISSDGSSIVVGYSSQTRGLVRFDGDLPATLVPGTNRIYQSAVRDGSAWYVVFDEQGAYTRTLHRVPLEGGSSESIGTYAPVGMVNTSHVVLAKTRAFFASHSTNNIGYCARDKSGCGEFATGTGAIGRALATDDTKVFWANDTTVVSCNVDATTPCAPQPVLPEAAGTAHGIVAHKGSLFMTMKSGDILECAAGDCSKRRTLISNQTFDTSWSILANNVAVDDDAVYYVTHVGSEYRLMRLSRTAR